MPSASGGATHAPAGAGAPHTTPEDVGKSAPLVEAAAPVPPPDDTVDAGAGNEMDGEAPADTAGPGIDDGSREGWQLAWSDEFDGPEGASFDTTKWNAQVGRSRTNNELEYYTSRADNVALDGEGHLVITARRESYMGADYTSSRLNTNGKFEVTFGRLEMRAKLPTGQGLWPAFWTLGTNEGQVGWPACGEMDIMENIGREPSTNHASLHGPGYSASNPLTAAYTLPGGARFSDDFHVFAAEWERDVIRFYVDDHLYETRTPDDLKNGQMWAYNHAFNLILNVAVGGGLPGDPNDNTPFPQQLVVDYVRAYAKQ
jgi:beta-glucanase (GH16 family)